MNTRRPGILVTIAILALLNVQCNLDKIDPIGASSPKASFTVNDDNCEAPCDPGFINNSTNVTDATTYKWDFGDGSESEEKNPTHTYDNGGIYSVTLTVKNDNGMEDDTTISVTINDAAMPPVADFSVSNDNCTAPCDPGFVNNSMNAVSYEWDFDDGNTSLDETPTHTYDKAGIYDVKLTVTSDNGQTAETTVTVTIKSNTWTTSVGKGSIDSGTDILISDDGSAYYILGYERNNQDKYEPVIYKLDENGNQQDKGTYGLDKSRTANRIYFNNNGDIAMASYVSTFIFGTGSTYMNIIDPISLNSKNEKEHKSMSTRDFVVTSNNEIVAAGGYSVLTFPQSTSRGQLYRFSTGLDSVWKREHYSTERGWFNAIKQLPSFNLVTAGYARPSNGSSTKYQMLLSSFSSNGWGGSTKIEIGNVDRTEYGVDFEVNDDGSYVVLGYSTDTTAPYYEPYLAKVSAGFGLTKEVDNYGFSATTEIVYDIEKTSDGGYVVVGYTKPQNGTSDVFLMKVDADLELVWNRSIGTAFNDVGNRVKETPDGGFLITGYTTIDENNRDIYIVKTDAEGNVN